MTSLTQAHFLTTRRPISNTTRVLFKLPQVITECAQSLQVGINCSFAAWLEQPAAVTQLKPLRITALPRHLTLTRSPICIATWIPRLKAQYLKPCYMRREEVQQAVYLPVRAQGNGPPNMSSSRATNCQLLMLNKLSPQIAIQVPYQSPLVICLNMKQTMPCYKEWLDKRTWVAAIINRSQLHRLTPSRLQNSFIQQHVSGLKRTM